MSAFIAGLLKLSTEATGQLGVDQKPQAHAATMILWLAASAA